MLKEHFFCLKKKIRVQSKGPRWQDETENGERYTVLPAVAAARRNDVDNSELRANCPIAISEITYVEIKKRE